MKKSTIVTFAAALIILSACQNATDTTKNAPDRAKDEKAVTSSKISIVVKGDDQAPTAPVEQADTVNLIVNADGFQPAVIEVKPGFNLNITNSQDQEAQLYTTTDGSNACHTLGATIELAAKETKSFNLEKTLECTVINQFNTNQTALIKVY